MNINSFFSNYTNHPVLFIGSGFSRRYIENSLDWDGLLSSIAFELYNNNEKYLDIKSKFYQNGNYRFDKIANVIESDFNKHLIENRDGKFKNVNDTFYNEMLNNNRLSRFKIYIANQLKEYVIKKEKVSELQELKKVRKNVGSVVTTNYDTLIEDIFDFEPLIGNSILLSNPYGAVYKIHGCVTSPDKIIINEEDYTIFESKYELIRAQLMSLFIHNPIVFLGYSISDSNIKSLLKTIFTYVQPNSELAARIRSNFLLIEYEKGSTNLDVVEHDIEIENIATLRINKLKTDNFLEVYKELSKLNLPISAMDIRKVQTIVKEINTGQSGIKVSITEDIDQLKNSDKVLVIGSKNKIKYEYANISELISKYFKIIEEENTELISLIDKFNIQSQQYFPIFAFSELNPSLLSTQVLKRQQQDKLESYLSKFKSKSPLKDNIKDILNDDEIARTNKNDCIFYSVINGKIKLKDLKEYLTKFKGKKNTEYNRLLCTYDLLKNSDIKLNQGD